MKRNCYEKDFVKIITIIAIKRESEMRLILHNKREAYSNSILILIYEYTWIHDLLENEQEMYCNEREIQYFFYRLQDDR